MSYTLQSQYAGTNIEALLNGIADVFYKNLEGFSEQMYTDYLDISSATSNGLDKWGALLDVPRNIPFSDVLEIDRLALHFEDMNFYKAQFIWHKDLKYLRLTDMAFRSLLQMKLLELGTNADIPQINHYMKLLFRQFGGDAYIEDLQNMEFATYVFNFEIPWFLQYAFKKLDVLPRPMGVGLKVIENVVYPIGFDGQDPNFEHVVSNFYRSNFKADYGEFDRDKFISDVELGDILSLSTLTAKRFIGYMPTPLQGLDTLGSTPPLKPPPLRLNILIGEEYVRQVTG